ncbi:78 kDa glucose-regulated protein [Elysia marginata]|uniref:78 kDa glucose-regulated protein n=1 Tax=Elysia marginata TaxID=1093978 RepID=A0AAV4JZM2_9GAST|nr:78 kDa glucose-regulated protein [Elysia marginata]
MELMSFFPVKCGGQDFDQRVMEHFTKLYKKKKKGKDIRKDNRAVQKLGREVEKAKRAPLLCSSGLPGY